MARRNLGLDILRAVAVFLVLGNHLRPPDDPWPLWVWLERGGWVGVDLFFVLSGFLVSGLLFQEWQKHGALRIGRFLLRRAFKLYPSLWGLVLATLAYWHWQDFPMRLECAAAELLFVQNYFEGMWNHTWSLAVEEHFYLLLAVLLVVLVRIDPERGWRWLPALFVVVGVACLLCRILNRSPGEPFDFPSHQAHSHIRIDSLFFGVFLSYLAHFRGLLDWLRGVPSWFLVGLGFLLLLPAFFLWRGVHPGITTWGFTVIYLGSGCLVVAALRLKSSRILPLRFLGVLGATSYSIYLWHMPVNSWGSAFWLRILGPDRFTYPVYLVCFVAGSLFVGWALSHLIEWPFLRLRDRLFPSRSGSPTISGGRGILDP